MDRRAVDAVRKRFKRWISGLEISRWRFNVALCLTVLLDMDTASAAAWTHRRGKWLSTPLLPQTPREALLQEALESAVLAVSAAYCASWTDPEVAALGMSALRAATRACRDKRVRDWVAERNSVHGAAVSSAAIVHRWNADRAADPGVGAAMGEIGVAGSPPSKTM